MTHADNIMKESVYQKRVFAGKLHSLAVDDRKWYRRAEI